MASILGPDAFQRFGALLRHLRLRAGLTQRDLATAVGYHYAHISRLERDERLPDTATLLALFVPALGLEAQPAWALRLLTLAAEARGEALPDTLTLTQNASIETTQVLPLENTPPTPEPLAAHAPRPLTPLLGREAERLALRQILARPEARLLTLIGPPGIGKTRLALQAAADLAGRFRHGAVWVDLTAALDPAGVVAAVAAAVGARDAEGRSAVETVGQALRERHLLLVLDNFEQVLGAAPALVGWLRAASGVKALVTSREHLRVSGEHTLAVQPLEAPPAPADGAAPSPDALTAYPAVALFVERAQPGFALTPENAAAVAEICARLDGLPLAIELAAARVKLLAPQTMRERLDRRLAWLGRGPSDGPAWRQTLRGAIDWSHQLLSAADQRVFAALAVFAGTFSVPAAEVVAGASLEQLDDLVGKSLLQALPGAAGGDARLRMLEILREYALDQLRADPAQAAAVRRAHAAYYLALAERVAPQLLALKTLEAEYDNLRAALGWAEAHDPRLGLRLAASLVEFWQALGRHQEGRGWLELFLKLAGAVPAEAADAAWRLRAMQGAGALSTALGDPAAAQHWYEQALALAQAAGEESEVDAVLTRLAVTAYAAGQHDEAARRYRETLALRRAHGTPSGVAQTLNRLGTLLAEDGRLEAAEAHLRESLAIRERLNDHAALAQSLLSLAQAVAQRDPAQARRLAEQSLRLYRAEGDQRGELEALLALAGLGLEGWRLEEATAFLKGGLRLALALGADGEAEAQRCLEGLARAAASQARSTHGPARTAHYRRVVFLVAAAGRFGAATPAGSPDDTSSLLAEARAALPADLYAAAAREGEAVEMKEVLRT